MLWDGYSSFKTKCKALNITVYLEGSSILSLYLRSCSLIRLHEQIIVSTRWLIQVLTHTHTHTTTEKRGRGSVKRTYCVCEQYCNPQSVLTSLKFHTDFPECTSKPHKPTYLQHTDTHRHTHTHIRLSCIISCAHTHTPSLPFSSDPWWSPLLSWAGAAATQWPALCLLSSPINTDLTTAIDSID